VWNQSTNWINGTDVICRCRKTIKAAKHTITLIFQPSAVLNGGCVPKLFGVSFLILLILSPLSFVTRFLSLQLGFYFLFFILSFGNPSSDTLLQKWVTRPRRLLVSVRSPQFFQFHNSTFPILLAFFCSFCCQPRFKTSSGYWSLF